MVGVFCEAAVLLSIGVWVNFLILIHVFFGEVDTNNTHINIDLIKLVHLFNIFISFFFWVIML
jgi:hypothetical protein